MMDVPDEEIGKLDRCLELFARHQQRLSMFISALLPSPADADEVLQETNIVIWKKFEQFDPSRPGSDFLSWAYQIASFQVREYKRRRGRVVASFSPEVLDQLTATAIKKQANLDARREALSFCLEKLPDDDRRLLGDCYAPEAKVEEIARGLRRTATSVYRSLRRIRRVLTECINRRLRQD